jgi:hypothetical protein
MRIAALLADSANLSMNQRKNFQDLLGISLIDIVLQKNNLESWRWHSLLTVVLQNNNLERWRWHSLVNDAAILQQFRELHKVRFKRSLYYFVANYWQ